MKTHLTLVLVLAISAIAAEYLNYFTAFAILKPVTTVAIITLVIRFYDRNFPSYTKAITLGLAFCLLGDCLLLKDEFFVYGLGAFLLAHLIFIFAFFLRGGWQWKLQIGTLVFSVGFGYFLFLMPKLGDLPIPVAVYISVICLMAWQGITRYFLPNKQLGILLMAASVLFVFSDAVIAFNRFIVPFDLANLIILSTYWLSISLIALSTTTLSKQRYKKAPKLGAFL